VDEYLKFLVTNSEIFILGRPLLLDGGFLSGGGSFAAIRLTGKRRPASRRRRHSLDSGRGGRGLGSLDGPSARRLFATEGQQYFVQELNFDTQTARLIPVALDYYTEPQRQTEIKVLTEADRRRHSGWAKKAGASSRSRCGLAGFKKLRWFTRENLGLEPLDLPPTDFQTTGSG